MGFHDLLRRVEDDERALELRRAQTRASWHGLRGSWRKGWTPTRIVLLGLAAGLVIGRARPARALSGMSAARWVQMGTSLWSLGASLRAKDAATSAEVAADEAAVASEIAAGTTAGVAAKVEAAVDEHRPFVPSAAGYPPGVPEARRRADPQWESAPRPAEAATELSEQR